MITVIYSTRKTPEDSKKFEEYLINSVGVKNIQVIGYINQEEYSLSELYNKGISESLNDIVVTCHDDIKIEKNWGIKLLNDFKNNPDYGIIGKAGSCYFSKSGVYWERLQQTMAGQVYHQENGGKKTLNSYSPKLPFIVPVVTIDGLFISFDKTKIKHTFDETIGKFHFYDHSFCLLNYLEGVKIGVTSSFEIIHHSVGKPNDEFFKVKDEFLKKYGEHLPLDLKPTNIFVSKIVAKPLKKITKVAIIIPTKDKTNLLFDCINSFIEHCDSALYEIFIGDTGSCDAEKRLIKNYINENKNKVVIHFIEYDYYNFGRINNDIIKNYVNDTFEYILFCNNDIKILNNVVYGMLMDFKTYPRAGTIGCRLYYEDNTIQHNGIMCIIDKKNSISVSHIGLKSYYDIRQRVDEVIGSTAALLMIRKSLFEKCGGFNEKYVSCFEDVELNGKCITMGYKNYFDGTLSAYHYESQTRNDDSQKMEKLRYDFNTNLTPFLEKNFQRFRKYMVVK